MALESSHPVPQNINSFEFHLVGDMTLKQFTYLASGLATAYLLFVFFAPSLSIIAWPLIIISALLGVCYAFLPIAERPLDHWTAAFFKAIFRPTQRSFTSSVVDAKNPNFTKRLDIYLNSIAAPVTPVELKPVVLSTPPLRPQPQMILQPTPTSLPAEALRQTLSQPQITLQPTPSPVSPPSEPVSKKSSPTSKELGRTVVLAKQAQILQAKIIATQKRLDQIKNEAATSGNNPAQYTEEFNKNLTELEEFNRQAGDISKQLALLSKTPTPPSPTVIPLSKTRITPALSLTSIPNIINGIVTDSQGNYLEGAIIVAHDKQGIPVRALKSNKLGQFITATPLPNGIYTLTIEKDDLVFNAVQIELKDEIMRPVLLSAQKVSVTN